MTDIEFRVWTRRPDWLDHRACADVDTALFFPGRGDNLATAAAKAVCAGCPVAAECLEYALENGERFGIWGGTSENERRSLRRGIRRRQTVVDGRPRLPVRCGTTSGYVTHYRHGEKPCDACREARSRYIADRRNKQKWTAA
jgi:WhiB family redox-sensing transcriptional regulator